jgi:hypothetical protein
VFHDPEYITFSLWTGFGNSAEVVGVTGEIKTQGMCQGNSAASAAWTVTSTAVINAHKKKGHGIRIVTPLTKIELHLAGSLFVDDTNLKQVAIGYSWFDGLLRNPWSGVQTPQVLGYSGMRVAKPLVGGSNPYGAGVSLHNRGLGSHMSNQGTPWHRFPGITD